MPGTPRKKKPHEHSAKRGVLAAVLRSPVGTKAKALSIAADCSECHVWHVLQEAGIQSAFVTPAERVLLWRHRQQYPPA